MNMRLSSTVFNDRVLTCLKVLHVRMKNGVLPDLNFVRPDINLTLNLKNEGPPNDDFKVLPWIKMYINQIVELRNLDSYHLTKMCDKQMFLPRLTSLTVFDRSLTAGFRDLSGQLPQFLDGCSATLQSLSLATSSRLTGLKRIKNDLGQLTRLHFAEHDSCDWAMQLLARCKVLTELEMSLGHSSDMSGISKIRLHLPTTLRKVKVVCFSQKRAVIPGFCHFLQKIASVESLILVNMDLTNIDGLSDRLATKELKLHKCSGLSTLLSKCDTQQITSISLHTNKGPLDTSLGTKLNNLKHVVIDGAKVDKNLEVLVRTSARQLETLELWALDLTPYLDLPEMSKLRKLSLHCCHRTVNTIPNIISRCSNSLEELSIRQYGFRSDVGARLLAGQKLPALKKLSLQLNRQSKENDMGSFLTACGPLVSDLDLEGIWQLNMFHKGFTNLRRLNLVPRRQALSEQLADLLPHNVIITHLATAA